MAPALTTVELFLIAMALIFTAPFLIWRFGRTDCWAAPGGGSDRDGRGLGAGSPGPMVARDALCVPGGLGARLEKGLRPAAFCLDIGQAGLGRALGLRRCGRLGAAISGQSWTPPGRAWSAWTPCATTSCSWECRCSSCLLAWAPTGSWGARWCSWVRACCWPLWSAASLQGCGPPLACSTGRPARRASWAGSCRPRP